MSRDMVRAAVALAAEVAAAWESELSPGQDDPCDSVRSRALEHPSDAHARLRDLLRDLEVEA